MSLGKRSFEMKGGPNAGVLRAPIRKRGKTKLGRGKSRKLRNLFSGVKKRGSISLKSWLSWVKLSAEG